MIDNSRLDENLAQPELVLASASPRRLDIMSLLGLVPRVLVSNIKETANGTADQVVLENAKNKANDVRESCDKNSLVIGADTVVRRLDKILGKPGDVNEAFEYLSFLSGEMHEVYSAIAILDNRNGKIAAGFSKTEVYFRRLSENDIKNYIKYADPYDKAGAYGIQDMGTLLVDKIEGNYGTVVGFNPILFTDLLTELGFNIWQFIENTNKVKK